MEFNMKKKLIVATAIVLLLAMSMTLLVGCDEIFKKNDKRDAQQVVASVTYTGDFGTQTENVYKFELASSFNSYAFYYVKYYGMTYEAAANYLAQSLAQQKLLTLFAKEKVAKLKNMTALPSSIAELLSASEKNKAIEDTNKSLLDSLVSTVESLITEDNANTSTSDSKKDNTTTKVTDPVYVRFESNGGSSVEKQKIQKDTVAKEPSDPTKDGYTFYGWYVDKEFNGEEFDFENTKITETTTLYAKWEKYLAPRTELPAEEEEDDFGFAPMSAAPSAAPSTGFNGQVLNMNTSSANKQEVVLFRPGSFNDTSKAADDLRSHRAVIVNMENVDKAMARRVVDFLSGCVYALDGDVKKIAQSAYLFCPHNMDIVGDLETLQAEVESYI